MQKVIARAATYKIVAGIATRIIGSTSRMEIVISIVTGQAVGVAPAKEPVVAVAPH